MVVAWHRACFFRCRFWSNSALYQCVPAHPKFVLHVYQPPPNESAGSTAANPVKASHMKALPRLATPPAIMAGGPRLAYFLFSWPSGFPLPGRYYRPRPKHRTWACSYCPFDMHTPLMRLRLTVSDTTLIVAWAHCPRAPPWPGNVWSPFSPLSPGHPPSVFTGVAFFPGILCAL